MFSYNLLQGDENQVLKDENFIVVSEKLAKRLFNTTDNAVGKSILLQHNNPVIISGVFQDVPSNSLDQFDFVLPFTRLQEEFSSLKGWGNTAPRTFVLLKNGTDIDKLNTKIENFIQTKDKSSNLNLFLRPFSDRYLYDKYENGVMTGGRIAYVRLFSLIALFILVIACINFMNLSTAKASRRLKEVGIKKTIGASRQSLIIQYLGESLLLTLISLIISVVLVELLLPSFNSITQKQLNFHFEANIIIAILAITLITGLLAGSYPAFYLSGFQPISVLKGELPASIGTLWARKGLVLFQFSLSVILIISVLVVYQQISFIQSKNLGYNKDNIIYFEAEGQAKEKLDAFISEVKNISGVINASSTSHYMMGEQSHTSGLRWEGKNPSDDIPFEIAWINYDMPATLGMEILTGRAFSKDFGADSTKIIFNEAAIETMGIKDPVGKTVNLWGENKEIIGVVKDFHFASLHEKVKPLFLILAPKQTNNIIVKIATGKEKQVITAFEQLHKSFNPGFPFEYTFLDEEYQSLYLAEKRISILSRYAAGLAILISCLGLFGLAIFEAAKKVKEIGIRKVLGASIPHIILLLSKDFLKLVFIAILLAVPISWYVMNHWLEGFAYRISIQWWVFVLAGAGALLIALLTVSFQAVRAAMANPVESLKTE
ncbi:MAG: FtsX-like permease family protein [Saprospiraceae bacterium]|nr:FtsX-like permease family protein [Saprospiraceae bacterium]